MTDTAIASDRLGFTRTICDCAQCRTPCRFMPGMLIPADVEPMSVYGNYANPLTWAKEYLVASPGGLYRIDDLYVRVGTLVPARQPDGSCVFFRDDHCEVHPVAPFGCACCDWHQDERAGNARSNAAVLAILRNIQDEPSFYFDLWEILHGLGRISPAPEISRKQMCDATGIT
jgi:hypothetical protein